MPKTIIIVLMYDFFVFACLEYGKILFCRFFYSGVGVPPNRSTKPTILRNCGRSFCPCAN